MPIAPAVRPILPVRTYKKKKKKKNIQGAAMVWGGVLLPPLLARAHAVINLPDSVGKKLPSEKKNYKILSSRCIIKNTHRTHQIEL
jgi:hypothetical protein